MADTIKNGVRVVFRMHGKRRYHRGVVQGYRVEPDGSIAYQIWDLTQGGKTYRLRDDFTVLRNQGRRA